MASALFSCGIRMLTEWDKMMTTSPYKVVGEAICVSSNWINRWRRLYKLNRITSLKCKASREKEWGTSTLQGVTEKLLRILGTVSFYIFMEFEVQGESEDNIITQK
jgi:hypothetical protein